MSRAIARQRGGPISARGTRGRPAILILILILLGAGVGYFGVRLLDLRIDPVKAAAIGAGGALIGFLVARVLLALTGALFSTLGALGGALLVVWLWSVWSKGR